MASYILPMVPRPPVAAANFWNSNGINDFQGFLLGAPAFSFGGGGVYNHRISNRQLFRLFIQDDYKIRNDLTSELGLRVEMNGAFHDVLNHIGNVDPNLLCCRGNIRLFIRAA